MNCIGKSIVCVSSGKINSDEYAYKKVRCVFLKDEFVLAVISPYKNSDDEWLLYMGVQLLTLALKKPDFINTDKFY